MKHIKFDARGLISDSDMVIFSLSELGCYIRLMSHYWLNGELPKNSISLAKLAGCSIGEFKEVWPKVSQHFDEGPEGFSCPGLDESRGKAKEMSDRMSNVAKARWSKRRGGS
jgi:uncharacterized protein YdaU (DUF1376 family)|tara:strand:+ start:774 stop:1109 length:336 start_codon:yes stop_codon:yes gene_type:complete